MDKKVLELGSRPLSWSKSAPGWVGGFFVTLVLLSEHGSEMDDEVEARKNMSRC